MNFYYLDSLMGCHKITYDYQEEGLEKSTVHFFWQLAQKRGQQKNRINYYPFGLSFNSYERTASTPQNFKLSGNEEQVDWGVGVSDFNARTYDATIGRFYNIDPLADERSSINPYNYVQNNPIARVDPSGLLDEWIPEVQEDGSTQYIAEEGDNIATFAEQYNLSDEQARAIFDQNGYQTEVLNQPDRQPAGEGDVISGESVASVTGSEVLKLDWQSNVTNDSKRIDQVLFAMEYSKSGGQFSSGDFLQNVPHHHDGDTYGFGGVSFLHGATTKFGGGSTKVDMMFNHRSKLPISTYSDASDNYYSKGGSYTFRFDNATGASYPTEAMFIRFKGASNMKNFTNKMGFPFSGRSKTYSPLKK